MLLARITGLVRAYTCSQRGSVAAIFAAGAMTLFSLVGIAIDYGGAQTAKERLQHAIDMATLAAANTYREDNSVTNATLSSTALSTVTSIMSSYSAVGNISVAMRVNKNTHKITGHVTADFDTAVMSIASINTLQITASSAVKLSAKKSNEIAIAIDVSTYMEGYLPELKSGVKALIAAIKSRDHTAKISIVPFSATVNIGNNFPGRWLDDSRVIDTRVHTLNAAYPRIRPFVSNSRVMADIGNCGRDKRQVEALRPFLKYNDNFLTVEPYGFGCYRLVTFEYLNDFQLFGSLSVAPEPTPPRRKYRGRFTATRNPPMFGSVVGPTFGGGGPTFGGGDSTSDRENFVSRFTALSSWGGWGGCVLARPPPYDVDDTPPAAVSPTVHNNLKVWAPYLWPDDSANDYLKTTEGRNHWLSTNSYNYNSTNSAYRTPVNYHSSNLRREVFDSWQRNKSQYLYSLNGPNRGCPRTLLPLTNDKTALDNYVDNIELPNAGGSVPSMGVSWAFRALSPGVPFTEGSADAKKTIILISTATHVKPADDTSGVTDFTLAGQYTGYGYVKGPGYVIRGKSSISDGRLLLKAREFLDERLASACTYAKNNGVKLYVILRHYAPISNNKLRDCASDSDKYTLARNSSTLESTLQGMNINQMLSLSSLLVE